MNHGDQGMFLHKEITQNIIGSAFEVYEHLGYHRSVDKLNACDVVLLEWILKSRQRFLFRNIPLNWGTARCSKLVPRLIDKTLLAGELRLKLAIVDEICVSRSFGFQERGATNPVKTHAIHIIGPPRGYTSNLGLISRCKY